LNSGFQEPGLADHVFLSTGYPQFYPPKHRFNTYKHHYAKESAQIRSIHPMIPDGITPRIEKESPDRIAEELLRNSKAIGPVVLGYQVF